jgi:dinuclear metal center YbgI/SA1388 family protein
VKLKELTSYLDSAVPLAFQESYDNSGLQAGSPERDIASAMITLDITENVIEEAIANKCDVVISHHPLIFHGIKSLTDKSITERVLWKAIRHDVAIYSAHTNLDSFEYGVSRKLAEKLYLKEVKVLSPAENMLLKLVTFIPESYLDQVRSAIFNAGAGVTGNYDNCGFFVSGTGSFRGNENSKPFVGKAGSVHHENEVRFETVLYSYLRDIVIKALLSAHPYEEVVYDLYALQNKNTETGTGCVGVYNDPVSENDFLKLVSDVLDAKGIRHSALRDKKIRKVALCGGSGASFIDSAIKSGADVFLTADLKYHDFFKGESELLLVDAGHFETEKYSVEIIKDLIIKKFPKFAVRFSKTNTNPINYF